MLKKPEELMSTTSSSRNAVSKHSFDFWKRMEIKTDASPISMSELSLGIWFVFYFINIIYNSLCSIV